MSAMETRRSLLFIAIVVAAFGAAGLAKAGSGDARSGHYRVISANAASVAGTASSPAHRVYIVGGSGAAVGIAASDNTSIVAGNSTIDPPERIFRSGFEAPF